MLVPRYWSKADGSGRDSKGKRYRFQIWGWSEKSSVDALATARKRLSEVISRIARGKPPDAYLYGKLPLREEILHSLGEAGSRGEALGRPPACSIQLAREVAQRQAQSRLGVRGQEPARPRVSPPVRPDGPELRQPRPRSSAICRHRNHVSVWRALGCSVRTAAGRWHGGLPAELRGRPRNSHNWRLHDHAH